MLSTAMGMSLSSFQVGSKKKSLLNGNKNHDSYELNCCQEEP